MFSMKLTPDTRDLAARQSDGPLEFGLGDGSQMGLDYPTRPVDNHSVRKSGRLVSKPACHLNDRDAPDDQWILNSVLVCELAHFINRIDGDTYNLDAIGCIFRLDSNQCRNFFPAGFAPGCPKIDYQNLVPPLGKTLVVSGHIREPQAHEFCRGLSIRSVGRCCPVREKTGHGGQHGHGEHENTGATHRSPEVARRPECPRVQWAGRQGWS